MVDSVCAASQLVLTAVVSPKERNDAEKGERQEEAEGACRRQKEAGEGRRRQKDAEGSKKKQMEADGSRRTMKEKMTKEAKETRQ